MHKKRGLSTLVATLLIILVSLVAVAVIWLVISSVLQKQSQQILTGQSNVALQIQKVQVEPDNVTMDVTVKRDPGEGNFTAMNLIFSDGKNSEAVEENVTLAQLGEQTFIVTPSNIKNVKTVSVAPILSQSSSQEVVGNPNSFDVSEIVTHIGPESNFAKLGWTGVQQSSYNLFYGYGVQGPIPNFKNVIINPLDVKVGENQTYTVTVYSPYNVTNVTSFTMLDNDNLTLNLLKTSDDNQGTSTWSATWTDNDTHMTNYDTTFFAIDSQGSKGNKTMSWTDDCSELVQNNGTDTIDKVCNMNIVGGAEKTSILIASGGSIGLGANADLVYNPGYSIGFQGVGGSIAFSGGSIQKGYLYYYDSDNDGYANNGTMIFGTSATAPSTEVRVTNALGTSDCDNSFASDITGGCGLVNGGHISSDCTAAGGTVVSYGKEGYCLITGTNLNANDGAGMNTSIESPCSDDGALTGWSLFNSMTQTDPFYCNAAPLLLNPFAGIANITGPLQLQCPSTTCTTSNHAFSSASIPVENCTYYYNPGALCPYAGNQPYLCWANVTEAACY